MPNELSIKTLLQNFSPATKKDWIKVANTEIKSHHALDELTWQGPDGIKFHPYYDASDRPGIFPVNDFNLPPTGKKLHEARYWRNLPPVYVGSETGANQKALAHLHYGAEGVLFEVAEEVVGTSFRPSPLLEGIQWPICHISFVFNGPAVPAALTEYILHYNARPETVAGTFFWKKIPQEPAAILTGFSKQKDLLCLGLFIEKNNDPAEEITRALCEGVKLADKLTEAGIPAEAAIRRMAFSIEAGASFFHTIAKLKALRLLWYQVARAYQVHTYRHTDVFIHTRCEAREDEKYHPNGHLLRSTTASMAAVMGGCDALTVYPEDRDSEVMDRIARNVSNILREESHFNLVADPLAGAYFADAGLGAFARHVWELFQKRIQQP